ncbi:hypothetical protein D3C87_79960 [compost metagenome]
MGYSIMTPFKNEQERDKMFSFIEKHYKCLSDLLGENGRQNFYSDRVPTCDLAYRPKSKVSLIGFNYNCSHPESGYYYSICYWMAIMAGRRKHFRGHKNVPYVNYDGCENWALFVNRERDKSIDSVKVNEYGFRTFKFKEDNESVFMKIMSLFENKIHHIDAIDNTVKQELIRLTKLWEIEHSI